MNDIVKKLILKVAGEPRSDWAKLALEAIEEIERLRKEAKPKYDYWDIAN